MPVIELKKLTKFFGAVPAVLEASLTVEEGDFFGFVGPNGSGKSTTIRMMMNYVRPTSGTATILGMDSRSQSGKLKKMVGYVPSEVDYYMDMRAMEVIRYAAAMRGLRDKSRIDQLCDLFEVDTVRRISHMSLGNRKKIALVTALLHSPKLLILDEPTSGLDSLIKRRFKGTFWWRKTKRALPSFSATMISERFRSSAAGRLLSARALFLRSPIPIISLPQIPGALN